MSLVDEAADQLADQLRYWPERLVFCRIVELPEWRIDPDSWAENTVAELATPDESLVAEAALPVLEGSAPGMQVPGESWWDTPLGLLTAAAGPDVPPQARWLQLRHAAELFDRIPDTMARWQWDGKLGQGPPTRGGGRKVPRADIADLLRSTNGDEPHQDSGDEGLDAGDGSLAGGGG